MERLSDLTFPPIVGQTYIVTCTNLNGLLPFMVPTLGDAHIDPPNDHNPPFIHVHIDFRFITDESLDQLKLARQPTIEEIARTKKTIIAVIRTYNNEVIFTESPMKCVRRFFYETEPNCIVTFRANGVKLPENAKLDDCMNCPHQGINLKNIQPVNGIITCPGHGLRYFASDGTLVPD